MKTKTIIDEPAMEFQDIAKELKIPLSTVHWLYKRGIKKLKENPMLIKLLIIACFCFLSDDANALSNREGKKGLFADISTTVDGITIRRIRDVEAGTFCYVVTSTTGSVTYPAISCIGWQP